MKYFLSFLTLMLYLMSSVGCTSEQTTVLKAVKKFQVSGSSLDNHMSAKATKLQAKAEPKWEIQKVEDRKYKIMAHLGVGPSAESFIWTMVKKGEPGSKEDESNLWRLKPESKNALTLMPQYGD